MTAEHLIYVVDNANRPLMRMDENEVHRQQLRHRGVAVLLWDCGGRLLLRRLPRDHPQYPNRLDIIGCGHVRAGEAAEVTAELHLPAGLEAAHATLTELRDLEQGAGSGNERVTFYGAVLPEDCASSLTAPDGYLFVDNEELRALARSYPDQLTPTLLATWQAKLHETPPN